MEGMRRIRLGFERYAEREMPGKGEVLYRAFSDWVERSHPSLLGESVDHIADACASLARGAGIVRTCVPGLGPIAFSEADVRKVHLYSLED